MADRKITDMSALAAGAQATDDVIAVVDVSEAAAADKNKKMTMEALFQGIPSNVGIGTASPSSELQVSSGAGTQISIESTADNSAARSSILLYSFSDGAGAAIQATRVTSATAADVFLSFRTGGSTNAQERFRIDSSGNVGIGTTNPTKPLDVNGDASINGLTVGRGAANALSNTAVGSNALNSNISGFSNTAVGQSALNSNTTGASNTAVGRSALISNTEGTENTALGRYAVFNNTTGAFNTAVGRSALISNTTGSYNTAIGRNAGQFIEGSNNTILGAYTGTSADATLSDTVIISAGTTERLRIDSSGNVGIGTTTPTKLLDVNGDASINGLNLGRGAGNVSSNVAFGNNAFISNTTGGSNTAVGSFALQDNTTGSNNTAFGRLTLEDNTTGINNTAVGSFALRNNTEGDFNTCIGRNAGQFIEGSNNTILGAYTGTSADATLSDTVIISAGTTERVRIDNSGRTNFLSADLGIEIHTAAGAGTTTALIDGRYSASANTTGSGTRSFIVFTNGNVQNTNNSYGAISDIKLKENIVDANSQWDDLKALQVRNYNFKEGQTHTQIGLVAQEVELVSPGLVSESPDRDEDGNDLGTVTKSVNYSVLYMKAVKALQEAMERIETLEAKVAALEAG